MKLYIIVYILCLIQLINCNNTDDPDYDFDSELLFKAFRQNVTLPTRKPPKKPTASPQKNTTLVVKPSSTPLKKPASSPPKNNTLISPSLVVKPSSIPPKKTSSPPKNTTSAVVKPENAPQGVVSAEGTPIPVVTMPTPVVTAPTVTNNGRCRCVHGQCGCCTGSVLAAFNQKACLNMTYAPDDFAFTTIMSVNERVLYKNTFSGKNPPPVCIRLPRLRAVKLCARFSNIYFSGPNMHTCIDFEAEWEDISLFETSFDCIRFGTGGIGILPPEEGGGANVVDEGDEDIDDYDDSAR